MSILTAPLVAKLVFFDKADINLFSEGVDDMDFRSQCTLFCADEGDNEGFPEDGSGRPQLLSP